MSNVNNPCHIPKGVRFLNFLIVSDSQRGHEGRCFGQRKDAHGCSQIGHQVLFDKAKKYYNLVTCIRVSVCLTFKKQ